MHGVIHVAVIWKFIDSSQSRWIMVTHTFIKLMVKYGMSWFQKQLSFITCKHNLLKTYSIAWSNTKYDTQGVYKPQTVGRGKGVWLLFHFRSHKRRFVSIYVMCTNAYIILSVTTVSTCYSTCYSTVPRVSNNDTINALFWSRMIGI